MKSDVYEILGNIANAFAKTGDTIKASAVAKNLKENNHKTTSGKEYTQNARSIFNAISAAYDYFFKKGDKNTADNIASAYVNDKNEHVWKK